MTTYIIFEMQTDAEGNTSFVPPAQFANEVDAWSTFYLTISYAIKSSVFSHTVMLCTNDGRVLDCKNYVHGGAA